MIKKNFDKLKLRKIFHFLEIFQKWVKIVNHIVENFPQSGKMDTKICIQIMEKKFIKSKTKKLCLKYKPNSGKFSIFGYIFKKKFSIKWIRILTVSVLWKKLVKMLSNFFVQNWIHKILFYPFYGKFI